MSRLQAAAFLAALALLTLRGGFAGAEEFGGWSVLDGIGSSSQVFQNESPEASHSTHSDPSKQLPPPQGSPESPPPPPPAHSNFPAAGDNSKNDGSDRKDQQEQEQEVGAETDEQQGEPEGGGGNEEDKSKEDQSKKRDDEFKSTGGPKSSCEAIACFSDASCGNAGCDNRVCQKCPTCSGTEASGTCVEKGKEKSCPALTCSPLPPPLPPPTPPSESQPPPSPEAPTPSGPAFVPIPTPFPPPPGTHSPQAPPIQYLTYPQGGAPAQVVEISQPEGNSNVFTIPWGGSSLVPVQGPPAQPGTTYIPVVLAVPSSGAPQQVVLGPQQGHYQVISREPPLFQVVQNGNGKKR